MAEGKRPAKKRHPESTGQRHDDEPFMVVGAGASAGGLEAFRELLEALPDATGMAYVFIQHLGPRP